MFLAVALFSAFLQLAFAQDCSHLLTSHKKRWLFDGNSASSFNSFPDGLKHRIPRLYHLLLYKLPTKDSTEVDRHCRFDLTRLDQGQKDTLKQLHDQGYAICVGCSLTSSDHGRCHSIDVCSKGSSCISGHNTASIPTYYFHGCCSDSDHNCRSDNFDFQVHVDSGFAGHHDFKIHYQKTVCKGVLCNENGYISQKTEVQQYLNGVTSAPSVNTTAATVAIDGGWSDWTQWGACDVTCGIGLRSRGRTCTNPAPRNGGTTCDGLNTGSELCNVNACP